MQALSSEAVYHGQTIKQYPIDVRKKMLWKFLIKQLILQTLLRGSNIRTTEIILRKTLEEKLMKNITDGRYPRKTFEQKQRMCNSSCEAVPQEN